MEAMRLFETSVKVHQAKRVHIPEGNNLYIDRCESLKPKQVHTSSYLLETEDGNATHGRNVDILFAYDFDSSVLLQCWGVRQAIYQPEGELFSCSRIHSSEDKALGFQTYFLHVRLQLITEVSYRT
jgi:hypothetical protein